MEKIVPMETFTSMLAEPSSGSYSTTYLPRGFPGGTGTGAWSSSEAVTHTRPVYCTLWRTVSLANRSSFCCRSPETFTAPAGPRMSLRPARRTCREMIFAARHKSYSRFDSSPVASGCSRSCSMMKRSIVMTSEPCTVPVREESDRAALVGPAHRDNVRRKPREHVGRRLAVAVVQAHADHRLVRRQLVEPRVRGRTARAVMTHLQELDRTHPPREPRVDRQSSVRLEQQSHGAVRHAQHHPMLVHIERQRHPERVRSQHLERDAVDLDPVAGASRVPARSRGFYPGEKLEVQRPPQRLPRLEYQLGIERFHHRGHAAEVIGVAVGRHRHGHPARALAPQERDHDTSAGVGLRGTGAAIHYNPPTVGRA